ncbi:hypothetical protein HY640_04815 [Candidatus Woesearchaeota archaeon]|nr:hypothetical protein [Candidatus Woesearchaeota archaeon]
MIAGTKKALTDIYGVHYRKLLVIPLVLIVASVAIIAVNYAVTGELFKRDVSLKGGITISVFTDRSVDAERLGSELSSALGRDVAVRVLSQAGRQTGFIVESEGSGSDVQLVIGELGSRLGGLSPDQYTVQVIGSSLSESFMREAVTALVAAFVLMGITVLLYFRVLVPSLFVISAAVSDILCTFAVMVLIDERLSIAGLAAFLMLIGYSVDTDILLTSRVIRGKEGSVLHRTLGAMKTGVFMTLTALAATSMGLVFSESDTIRQIMLVLTVGLVFDMVHTWITNAGVLRWYLESRGS